jgi:peptidoglycan/LPS O-acetylase OafA/YrhL
MTSSHPAATMSAPVSVPGRDRKFRPDIEGLRAIAVVMVMLNHAGLAALSGGYVGVDVFFVLSGFLITGILADEINRTGGISFSRFYARRARRLLPAGALVLLVTVVATYNAFGPARGNRVADDARWASLFASNIRFIREGTDYLGAQEPPSPLQHFWSLAVEEQFYFVWPALILLVAVVARQVPIRLKLGVVLTVMIAASLAWSVSQTAIDGTTAYFSPLTRAYELAAGALLAVALPWVMKAPRRLGVALGWTGIALVLWTGLAFTEATMFPGWLAALPVIGTMLVIAGGTVSPARGVERILATRPFQWIGKLSYSLYLWHWPVLMIVPGWVGHELSVPQNLGLLEVAALLSVGTYLMIEDPVRASTVLARRPPLVSVGLGASLVAVTVGMASWLLAANALPGEQIADIAPSIEIASEDEVLREVAAGEFVTEWPAQPPRIRNLAYSDACDVSRKDTESAACVHGDPEAERTVVVFGDSHAAMWIPAFDEIGKRNHWRVIQLTKPGCIAPDFRNYSNSLGREYTECAEYRDWAIGKIGEIKPDMVIVTSARHGVVRSNDGKPTQRGIEGAWREGLGSILQRLTPLAGKVVVLGDMAYPNEKGIDCLTANPGHADACNTPREDAVLADHNAMEAEVSAENGATYVDVIPWFCTDTTCPAVIADLTVRRDSMHVAENYAVWLSGVLADATGLVPPPGPDGEPGTPERDKGHLDSGEPWATRRQEPV